MAVRKCNRSGGNKPDTKQVVALATSNLAMERGLQESLSIGQVVTVLSVQLVLAMFNGARTKTKKCRAHDARRETGKTSA